MIFRSFLCFLFVASSAYAQEVGETLAPSVSVPEVSTPSLETEADGAAAVRAVFESQNLGQALDGFSVEELNSIRAEILPMLEDGREPIATTVTYQSSPVKVACTICVATEEIECSKRKTKAECVPSPPQGDPLVDETGKPASMKPPVDDRGFALCGWDEQTAPENAGACYSLQSNCCRTICQGAEQPHQCIVTSGRSTPSSSVSPSLVASLVEEKTGDRGPCDAARTQVYFTGHGNSNAYQFASVTACPVGATTHVGCQTFGLTTPTAGTTSAWAQAMEWAIARAKDNKTVTVCGNQMTSLGGSLCQPSSTRMCVQVRGAQDVRLSPGRCFDTTAASTSRVQCGYGPNESPYTFCSTALDDSSGFNRHRLGCQLCEADSTAGGYTMGHFVPVERARCCEATGNTPREFCQSETNVEAPFRVEEHWGCCENNGSFSYSLIPEAGCPLGGTEALDAVRSTDSSRPLSRQECRERNGYCCVLGDSVSKVNSIQECAGTVPFPEDLPASDNFCPRTTAADAGDPFICCDTSSPSALGAMIPRGLWQRVSQCRERSHSNDCSRSCYQMGATTGCCQIPVTTEHECNSSAISTTCCELSRGRYSWLYDGDCTRLGGRSMPSSSCTTAQTPPQEVDTANVCCHKPVYHPNSTIPSPVTVPVFVTVAQCLAETGSRGVAAANEAACLATAPFACCERPGDGRFWERSSECGQNRNGFRPGRILTRVMTPERCR